MKKIFCVLIIFLMTTSISFAKSVQVTGQGVTERAAIHNAMRIAIEEVLGAQIDSKTLVQNNQVIEDEISVNSEGFISSYEIISKNFSEDFFTITIKAEVNDKEIETRLLSRLQKKTLIETNANSPRIAVLAYDSSGAEYYEVENEILSALSRQGFTHITDFSQINRAVKTRILNAENDPELRKSLQNDFHIDYIVLSEIKFSNQARKNVTISSRLIRVNTGQIIYAGNSSGNIGSLFNPNSENFAINIAARHAGYEISKAALNSAAKVEQYITLLVTENTFKKIGGNLSSVNEKIKKIDGVNKTFVRKMSRQIEIDINFDGTAADLAIELERAGFSIIEVTSDFVKI